MTRRHEKIISKNLYNYNAAGYCGVLMPENVMKKIAKLCAQHSVDVRKVLDDHKDELYSADWTLASHIVDGSIEKQVTVDYTLVDPPDWDCVDRRIQLFSAPKPRHVSECYMVESREEATAIAEEILDEIVSGGVGGGK